MEKICLNHLNSYFNMFVTNLIYHLSAFLYAR